MILADYRTDVNMDHSGEESPMNSQTRTHSHLREEKKKETHSSRKKQRAKLLNDNFKLSELIFSLAGERHVTETAYEL